MNQAAARSLPVGAQRISLAILAMGGQGGGVLADWIVSVAEAQGWAAQSTSVPGVAQRTGATIYYLEMAPPRDGVSPVFALMPTPGDVDVVLASELMEAGRSVLRGLVTPERTTLIASTHRALAIVEKQAPGDGVADPTAVTIATDFAAKRVIAFDMEGMAKRRGSVISASMFGALAASRALPFAREAFEAAIRSSGAAVDASLAAFRAAYEQTEAKPVEAFSHTPEKRFVDWPEVAGDTTIKLIGERIRALPVEAQPMLVAGARKLVDYLDPVYALDYLGRVERLHGADFAAGGAGKGFAFTIAAAKYLANALTYDDVPRVADLKIRASRQARVRQEVGAAPETLVATTEYFHPRVEELCGSLPKAWGEWIEQRPRLVSALRPVVDRGRRIRTNTISGYLLLAIAASFRKSRRGSLRHAREMAHVEAWLKASVTALQARYELGVETLSCRRLVKGYSDTHARGVSKFDRVMSMLPKLMAQDDGAVWLERAKRAALMDEKGAALDGVMKTIDTL